VRLRRFEEHWGRRERRPYRTTDVYPIEIFRGNLSDPLKTATNQRWIGVIELKKGERVLRSPFFWKPLF